MEAREIGQNLIWDRTNKEMLSLELLSNKIWLEKRSILLSSKKFFFSFVLPRIYYLNQIFLSDVREEKGKKLALTSFQSTFSLFEILMVKGLILAKLNFWFNNFLFLYTKQKSQNLNFYEGKKNGKIINREIIERKGTHLERNWAPSPMKNEWVLRGFWKY